MVIDLGMITQDDVIIALSWSGESNELKAILCHARRFSIPLIAITSENKSILACHADIVLKLPKEPEACPYGLAPTTSTIMQLAIGDALAMALMETENFTENDFYALHPGGKLGSIIVYLCYRRHAYWYTASPCKDGFIINRCYSSTFRKKIWVYCGC